MPHYHISSCFALIPTWEKCPFRPDLVKKETKKNTFTFFNSCTNKSNIPGSMILAQITLWSQIWYPNWIVIWHWNSWITNCHMQFDSLTLMSHQEWIGDHLMAVCKQCDCSIKHNAHYHSPLKLMWSWPLTQCRSQRKGLTCPFFVHPASEKRKYSCMSRHVAVVSNSSHAALQVHSQALRPLHKTSLCPLCPSTWISCGWMFEHSWKSSSWTVSFIALCIFITYLATVRLSKCSIPIWHMMAYSVWRGLW